ncbi:Carbon monoxide dehydrogenase subunit G [Cohaesibacter sp. ES.047]|uniref:hypothetical protein n=1 Tax=Cohaesibacter sp. ES.047 TaxID=1798205 RepID=UPI000BB82297|nr:hypothetical protein [Cohaesibacter sp. ES.047]SNY93531.1 Carbon monoxide dehydrogenase subunit G [Cohaesibacter sp. ES.047]
MYLSGEHRIKSTPAKVRRQFENPETLKRTVPHAVSAYTNSSGKTIITVNSLRSEGEVVQYVYFVEPGETVNDFTIYWKPLDEKALFAEVAIHCTLRPDGDSTVVSFNANLEFLTEDHYLKEDKKNAVMLGITELLEEVADNMDKEQRPMTDQKSDLEEAVSKAEDAVTELEQEAEEAAVKGVWGGPQMWGWIALAVVIVVLLIFFR